MARATLAKAKPAPSPDAGKAGEKATAPAATEGATGQGSGATTPPPDAGATAPADGTGGTGEGSAGEGGDSASGTQAPPAASAAEGPGDGEQDAAKALEGGNSESDAQANTEGAFEFPDVDTFPATLTLTNATPGRFHVAGTDETLAPGETRDVTFATEKEFARFDRCITQLAELNRWQDGQGLLIEQGADDVED